MKKIYCILLSVFFVLCACSCQKDVKPSKKINSDTVSENTVTSSENKDEGIESENEISSEFSSEEIISSNESSSIVTSQPTTTNTPSTNTPPSNPNASTKTRLTIDFSRSVSNDVGTTIENDYIYYVNPNTGFPAGLFRKKISGGEEETVVNCFVSDYKVLNGKVYYISGGDVYCCDVNGANNTIIDGNKNAKEIYVAGKWIFVKRNLGTSSIGRVREELCAVKIDGSKKIVIKPNCDNSAGSLVDIHGFNRGYCYVSVTYEYNISSGWTLDIIQRQIDYRSDSLEQKDIIINADYEFEGQKVYWYNYKGNIISYDHILQTVNKKNVMVSIPENKGFEISPDNFSISAILKDYCVYTTSADRIFSIVFVDFKGNQKNKIDLYTYKDEHSYMYTLYHKQDINSNNILIQVYDITLRVYDLLLVSPDGNIVKIYSKNSK